MNNYPSFIEHLSPTEHCTAPHFDSKKFVIDNLLPLLEGKTENEIADIAGAARWLALKIHRYHLNTPRNRTLSRHRIHNKIIDMVRFHFYLSIPGIPGRRAAQGGGHYEQTPAHN